MKEKKVIPKKYKRESGFTLIELLVVIGIIAVLATIGTISFGNAASKSRDAKRQADLKTMSSGLQIYNTRMGAFPASAVATSWQGFLGLLGVSGATPPRQAGENYCYYARSGGTQSLNAFMLIATDFENEFPSDALTDTESIFGLAGGDDTAGIVDDFVVDSQNRVTGAATHCIGRSEVGADGNTTFDPNCQALSTDYSGDGGDYCIKGSSTALF